MSLINDALKRARQTQQQNPFGGQPTVPLQPVDYAAGPNRWFRMIVVLLVLVSLALSVCFFWKWWQARDESAHVNEAANASPVQSKTIAKPASHKAVIQVSTNIVVRTNLVAPPKAEEPVPLTPTNVLAAAPSTNTTTLPTETPAPPSPFADLKLQSIIYREDKPAAVINGEMVFVGDEIKKARVLKIDRQAVMVERNGETNMLRLPRL
jgi:hypothetical protein